VAEEFHVFDTHTWKKVGTIKTKMSFWSAAVSNDGKTLYATAPRKHSILVIDTIKMRQTRVLKVGGSPALALVAP
jgi:DNA-binding beta-propeller fold protein YncE